MAPHSGRQADIQISPKRSVRSSFGNVEKGWVADSRLLATVPPKQTSRISSTKGNMSKAADFVPPLRR